MVPGAEGAIGVVMGAVIKARLVVPPAFGTGPPPLGVGAWGDGLGGVGVLFAPLGDQLRVLHSQGALMAGMAVEQFDVPVVMYMVRLYVDAGCKQQDMLDDTVQIEVILGCGISSQVPICAARA